MTPAASAPYRTGLETRIARWPWDRSGAMCRLRSRADSRSRAAGAACCTGRSMNQGGFTLVEVLMVVAILVVLASMVLPRLDGVLDGDGSTPGQRQKVAMDSLNEIRFAITGTPAQPGYLMDVRQMPAVMTDLLIRSAGVPVFDPVRQSGWNG